MPIPLRKFLLPQGPAYCFCARHPARGAELLGSHRAGVRIGQRGGGDLFVGHGAESSPIRSLFERVAAKKEGLKQLPPQNSGPSLPLELARRFPCVPRSAPEDW